MSQIDNRSNSDNKNYMKKIKIISSKSIKNYIIGNSIKNINSDTQSKFKIGFKNLLNSNIKPLNIDNSNEKTSRLNTNILFSRQFKILRTKNNTENNIKNINNNNIKIPISKDYKNLLTETETNPIISLFNSKKYNEINFLNKYNLKNKEFIKENKLLKIKQFKDYSIKSNDLSNDNFIKIRKTFYEKSPIKIDENIYKKINSKTDIISSTHSNFYSNKPNILNGYKEFLSKIKLSNLPTLVRSCSSVSENTIENDSEKQKYDKLSETFLKIKCLLSLDCKAGNEREYIKNFFIRFGYKDKEVTEDKITNFLNFLNIEPFQLNPSKSLNENILFAMNNKISENDLFF